MFASMRKAVGQAASSIGLAEAEPRDERLQQYTRQLAQVDAMIKTLRKTFGKYAQSVLAFNEASQKLSTDVSEFYKRSQSRQQSVQLFVRSTNAVNAAGSKIFKDEYGWEVLKSFDEWQQKVANAKANIKQVDAITKDRERLEADFARLQKNNAPRSVLVEAKEKIAKSKVAHGNMKKRLHAEVTAVVQNRFQDFDSLFVRIMESQLEYFQASVGAMKPCKANIDNYRKRYPRESKSAEPTDSFDTNTSITASDLNSSDDEPDEPDRDAYAGFQRNDDDESGNETSSSSSDEMEDPSPVVSTQQTQQQPTAVEPVSNSGGMDFFSFDRPSSPSPSPPNEPAPAMVSPVASESDLLGFFGGPTSPPPVSQPFDNTPSSFNTAVSDPFATSAPPTPSAKPKPRVKKVSSSNSLAFNPLDDLNLDELTSSSKPTASNDFMNSFGGSSGTTDHVANDVGNYNANVAAAAELAEAKRGAQESLESKLSAWECKNGQPRAIDALLTSLDTILWPNSGYVRPDITALMDKKGVRKEFKKAVKIVHPDHLRKNLKPAEPSPEQHVIAQRAYSAIKAALTVYMKGGGNSNQMGGQMGGMGGMGMGMNRGMGMGMNRGMGMGMNRNRSMGGMNRSLGGGMW